jgi:hypothetical protein
LNWILLVTWLARWEIHTGPMWSNARDPSELAGAFAVAGGSAAQGLGLGFDGTIGLKLPDGRRIWTQQVVGGFFEWLFGG